MYVQVEVSTSPLLDTSFLRTGLMLLNDQTLMSSKRHQQVYTKVNNTAVSRHLEWTSAAAVQKKQRWLANNITDCYNCLARSF